MASWQFHSLFAIRHMSAAGVPEAHRQAFHLGCFAPDLVRDRRLKKDTHYQFGVGGVALGYRIGRFRLEADRHRDGSPDQAWFYRGYLLHLLIDSLWLKRCVVPAVLRFAVSPSVWGDTRSLHYPEMMRADAYIRYLNRDLGAEAESLRLFAESRQPEYFPESLAFDAIEEIVGVLEKTCTVFSETLDTRILRERDLQCLVDRTMAITI